MKNTLKQQSEYQPGRTGASSTSSAARQLSLAQGVFYIASGVWPLVSLRTFEKVTGPKVDGWLVKTVGALLAVIGAALVVDARREGTPSSGKLLGMGSAGALATIDIVYTAKGRISKVYLLDALLELGIVGAWACLGPELDVDTSTGA